MKKPGRQRIGENEDTSCSIPVSILYVICVGLAVWVFLLSFIDVHAPANLPLNPVVNDISFAPSTSQVSIDIALSVGSVAKYQYVGVIRRNAEMIDSLTTPAHTMPRFSAQRLKVLMPLNFTFERGDLIVHQYYSGPDIMFASLLAQTSKFYQNQCLVHVKNTSVPYCWDKGTQTYCQTPRIGITGPLLTNVSGYIANRTNHLKLDPTNGCYYALEQYESVFTLLFPDIVVMPNNLSDCFIFNHKTNAGKWYFPTVFFDPFAALPADPVMSKASVFINFGNSLEPDVFIQNPSQIFVYDFDENIYNNDYTNITICGYVQSMASYGSVPRIQDRLSLQAESIFQWGNLGLEEFSVFYDDKLTYMMPSDTQPSFETLKSIPAFFASFQFFFNGLNPVNIFSWNMSKIENFFALFDSWDLSLYPQIDALDTRSGRNFSNMFLYATFAANQTLAGFDMSKAENVNRMFNGAYGPGLNLSGWRFNAYQTSFASTFANFYGPNNISISQWNPTLATNLDYFATGSTVYPNILSWKIRPDLCANDMINYNYAVDTPLYDALLIKFHNETYSTGCTWQYTQVPRSNASNAAYAGLCARGWHISDTVDSCN